MDVAAGGSCPRPVVADMSVTPWSEAVEAPSLCTAVQVPAVCPKSVERPAPSSPPASPPTSPPRKSRRTSLSASPARLSQPSMRSSRHRRRSRGHTFPRSPYPVGQFLELLRPDGEPWLAVTRLLKAQEVHDGPDAPRRQRDAQGVFDDFFKHVGGRMASGDLALIYSPRLDMPYIRLAEEVMYVHRLDALLARILSDAVPSYRDCELFCYVGSLRYWYGWNRDQFGKDMWDEHRLRGSARRYANAVFGWHNRGFHDIPLEDRARLFWPMPADWSGYEANRVLSVPSPAIAHYAATSYHATAPGSAARTVLDRIFVLEYVCNFVLSHAQACTDGIYYSNYPDRRMKRDYRRCDHPGRLFRLPRRVVQTLSEIHPFFFLESSGIDPARGFLALRRAQEFVWDDEACAAVGYNFQTGEPLSLPGEVFDNQVREPNHPGEVRPPPRDVRTSTYEACTPTVAVSRCTLRDCEVAWERFRTLSRGCAGSTGRVQLSRVITMVLNSENHGIETSALTTRRKSLVGAHTQWDVPTRRFDRTVEHHLNELVDYVKSLPEDPEDAGLSAQPSGTCNHPEGIVLAPNSPRPVPNLPGMDDGEPEPPLERPPNEADLQDEFYGPPPEWLPAHEGYLDLEAAFHRLQAAYRRAELTVPVTVCGGLDLACDGARRITELMERMREVTASLNNVTVNRNNLRQELASSREEVSRLRQTGSSSSADSLRADVASMTAERDRARVQSATLAVQRDEALTSLLSVTSERDTARASLATAESERDAARTALAAMESERDAALASAAAVTAERDTSLANLAVSQASLVRVRGELAIARTSSGTGAAQAELSGVRAELADVEADLTGVRTELAAARTARASADRRATRIVAAVQAQLGELVTTLGERVQEAADEVSEEARKAAAGESSTNPHKRLRGA